MPYTQRERRRQPPTRALWLGKKPDIWFMGLGGASKAPWLGGLRETGKTRKGDPPSACFGGMARALSTQAALVEPRGVGGSVSGGVHSSHQAPAVGKGRWGCTRAPPPAPGSSTVSWRPDCSALENSGCPVFSAAAPAPGPPHRLLWFFMTKVSPPTLSGTGVKNGPTGARSEPPCGGHGRARFS